ncbi:MAG: ATP synthase F1 subunit delta [Calditrichaceae bacterium]
MSRVAKRYAKALFQLGVEEKKLEQLENDLSQIENLLKESENFNLFIANPLISEIEKAKIMAKLFKGKLSDAGYNFLQLLTSKKRSSLLPDCIEQFRLLLHQHRNILKGELFSVVDLSDAQVEKIKENVEKMTGKSVIFDKHLDSSLLGGFIIKIEDIIIDNSIRFQLNKLRERLIVQ